MSTWQVGETVFLKSGSPEMTIKSVDQGQVVCMWFDGAKMMEAGFHAAMLESKATVDARNKELEAKQSALFQELGRRLNSPF